VSRNRSDLLTLFRMFIGPTFVIGGWQLTPLSYVAGVLIVYAGFVLCLAEFIWEPALLNKPYQVQIALIGIVFALAVAFSINVVSLSAPLNFDSYAMRNGEYPSGTVIAGIHWDSHLTDLRVSITNPTDADYYNLDLAVQPDKWNYKAGMLEENTGCLLTSIGGNGLLIVDSAKGGENRVTMHRVGDKFEASDSLGDVFEHFITEGGYRLRCDKFPAKFTVQIVFALASIKPELRAKFLPRDMKPGVNLTVTEWLPMNKFDILEVKPSPSRVAIQGNYARGIKRFSISRTVQITDGN
jgi:hypothetical protein